MQSDLLRGQGGAYLELRLNRTQSSVGGRALDALYGVHRQTILLPLQFEAEFAEDGEDCGQPREPAHVASAVRRRRGQPHGDPAFRVYGKQPAERRSVYDWQIRPVADVVGNVVHVYGMSIQGMEAQAGNKVMAVSY